MTTSEKRIAAPAPYKLVVFDFDGTLADSFGWFLQHFDAVADKFRFKRADRQNMDALRNLGARELMAMHKVPAWKLPLIAAHVRKLQAGHMHHIDLFEGIEDVIRTLKARGVRVAIVSSNAEPNIRAALGPDLSAMVDQFACGASVFGKAQKFRAVRKAAGVPAAAVLSVGDEIRDIEAARKVGFECGAVSWGFANPSRLAQEKPDHLFSAPADILKMFGTG